jgi:DNA mismatch repair protein MutL
MKRDSAEANAITSIMQKIVLSHPEISFKLIKDNKVEFTSAGDGELYSAVYGVYGRDFAHDLIPVDYSENGITVKGYIIKPLYSKSNRAFQNFFINGRFVKSVTCCVSIEEAYKNLIMVGKYPACVLMLDVPPVAVDVNVHPAKAEVRFSDEKIIFNSVYFAVKNALMASGLVYEFQMKEEKSSVIDYKAKPFEPEKFEQPSLETKPNAEIQTKTEPETEKIIRTVSESVYSAAMQTQSENDYKMPEKTGEVSLSSRKFEYGKESKPLTIEKPVAVSMETDKTSENSFKEFSYINSGSFKKSEPVNPPVEKAIEEQSQIKVMGELFKNYILAESGDNMVMIDKHAAHERIIFERLKGNCTAADSQFLLNESEILLSENECEALSENNETLESMGFKLDTSKAPFVKIKAVPLILDKLNMDEIVPEIAENFYQNKINPQTHLLDDMLHDLACKAAIKANDKNSIPELQKLAEDVFYNENIRHCPHGRPVMFILSKRDIEKQFKRVL